MITRGGMPGSTGVLHGRVVGRHGRSLHGSLIPYMSTSVPQQVAYDRSKSRPHFFWPSLLRLNLSQSNCSNIS